MTPEEMGMMGGAALVSFFGGMFKGKRSNGNGDSQTGNGHFREAWAKTVDKRLDVVGEKLDAIGEDLTNLRIDLGAKR